MSGLEILVAVILILWAVGYGFTAAGSVVHLLLILALALFVIRLIQGRRL